MIKAQRDFIGRLRRHARLANENLEALALELRTVADTSQAALALLDDARAAQRFLSRTTDAIDAIGCFIDRIEKEKT